MVRQPAGHIGDVLPDRHIIEPDGVVVGAEDPGHVFGQSCLLAAVDLGKPGLCQRRRERAKLLELVAALRTPDWRSAQHWVIHAGTRWCIATTDLEVDGAGEVADASQQ